MSGRSATVHVSTLAHRCTNLGHLDSPGSGERRILAPQRHREISATLGARSRHSAFEGPGVFGHLSMKGATQLQSNGTP